MTKENRYDPSICQVYIAIVISIAIGLTCLKTKNPEQITKASEAGLQIRIS